MARRRQNLTKFLLSPQTCGEKRRYKNESEAKKVAEEQELLNPGLKLRTYKCILCDGWHLTRHNPDVI